ncbi:MAG: LPS export ABC transporter periplasmic protein LptC [Chthoniobacterales bacterium]|nr:LPS export ABC transporter periplasmic protein LptC [Chthoniobacterales bacterium]
MLRSRSALRVFPGARFSLLLAVACTFFLSSLEAKRPKNATPPPKDNSALKDIPLTVGHEAKGLVLPNYDVNGHLLGRFEAATASRLDEDHVRFDNLKIHTFDEHEKPDLTIDMTEGILNLETRIIDSKTRTKVTRADFEITGDAMHFNTATHQGTMTGNVHMTVYDPSQLGGKKK